MIAAMCFGSVFGLPFIACGIILIADRDRTWRRKSQRSTSASAPQRTAAWDRRQIFYGLLLILLGSVIFGALAAFNYFAQSIAPAAPF